MEAKQRTVITNEDDTRKVEVYTQGDVDVTPTGIPIMASDAGGTIRILKQDNLGNLNVNVAAGGAGGGVAQTQVENAAGTWTDVGYAAADMKMPVEVFGAGGSISVSIAGSSGSMGVYLDAINQTIAARVGQVDGTVAVYFSPSLPTIKGINDSISIHVLSTNGTMGVRFSDEPYVVAEGKYGATKAPIIVNTDGALKIYDVANGTMTVNSGTGTLAVRFSDEPYVVTEGKYGATKIPTIHNTDGAIKVYDVVNGTMTVNAGTGTMSVLFNSEPTVVASGKDGATTRPLRSNSDGAIKVYDLTAGTVSISGYTGTIGVYVDTIRQTAGVRVGQVDGTVAVYFSQSNPKVNLGSDIINIGNTASVASAGGSVSGSTSGVSVSGVQLIAPVASRVIKVYAFSLTTTAQVHLSPRFTNGAGTGPTELWRVGLQAPAQGIAGANLAVTPPGYLFATPSGATLCLVLDSASLVHYSVAYFRETA